jgi:hypothetical protein
MRCNTVLGVAAITTAVFATAAIVSACGGSTDAAVDGGEDATTTPSDGAPPPPEDGSPSSDDGSTPIDGSTVSDGSTTADGGTTPGQIACGATSCNSANQVCCIRFAFDAGADGGPGVSRTCTAPNQCQGGAVSECDEKADCPMNQVCCLQFGASGPRGSCQNGCGTFGIQMCKTTLECTNDGGTCKSYTCLGNTTVQACRQPMGCQ